MYQHNVFKFYNELDKIFTQYLEFIMDLHQDWLNYWKIILNSTLPVGPNFENNLTKVTPNSRPAKESFAEQRKIKKTGRHEIHNSSLSKLPLF